MRTLYINLNNDMYDYDVTLFDLVFFITSHDSFRFLLSYKRYIDNFHLL